MDFAIRRNVNWFVDHKGSTSLSVDSIPVRRGNSTLIRESSSSSVAHTSQVIIASRIAPKRVSYQSTVLFALSAGWQCDSCKICARPWHVPQWHVHLTCVCYHPNRPSFTSVYLRVWQSIACRQQHKRRRRSRKAVAHNGPLDGPKGTPGQARHSGSSSPVVLAWRLIY